MKLLNSNKKKLILGVFLIVSLLQALILFAFEDIPGISEIEQRWAIWQEEPLPNTENSSTSHPQDSGKNTARILKSKGSPLSPAEVISYKDLASFADALLAGELDNAILERLN